MCGIAGIVLRAQAVSEQLLRPMAESLGHRGPDGRGFFTDGPFGLVHTRLSIIDLSGGQQPLLADGGQLALVANGEVYNYIELREELQQAGRGFATHSDSETILHAYALDPTRFVERLHGMFAFALYDGARRRMVLGRDRLGIKPLFYATLPDRVIFASEPKAILPLMSSSPRIDPTALSEFLHNQFSGGERTIFTDIRRIAPGELVEIDESLRVTRRRYWSALNVAPRALTEPQALEEFEPLFERVMREHVRSDVPYGLFLSGGNDSAILLAMLSRLQSQPVRTFSIGYAEARMTDELDDAERIARLFGSEHSSIRLDRAAVFRRIPQTIWAADELMRDYATLPTAALAEAAGAELKVVFSGEGGDEAFAGYGRYRQNPWLLRLKNLLRPGSGGFRTSSQWHGRWSKRLLGPELSRQRRAARQPVINAWRSTPPGWSHLQRCQYTDLVTALPDNLLVKADRMLMAFALEGRVPFLDHRVVEFGLALPDRLKAERGDAKILLRRWAERVLPRDHLYRRKRGFHVPVGEWLSGEFLGQLEGKLMANRAVATWFRHDQVPRLFHAQRNGRNASREIWSLMQFAIWHRIFIDGPCQRPSSDEDPLEWID